MAVASALDLVALVLDAAHVAELVVLRATVAVRANPPSITGARPGCRAAVALPVAGILGALSKTGRGSSMSASAAPSGYGTTETEHRALLGP